MRSQKLRKISILLSAISFTTTVASCTVDIKNQRWYGDKGALGAVYFETQTTITGSLDKPTWDTTRFGMVCTDAKNFADVKAAQEKLCHDTGECRYLNDPIVQNFFRNIDAVSEH